jgi:hypothetical protein
MDWLDITVRDALAGLGGGTGTAALALLVQWTRNRTANAKPSGAPKVAETASLPVPADWNAIVEATTVAVPAIQSDVHVLRDEVIALAAQVSENAATLGDIVSIADDLQTFLQKEDPATGAPLLDPRLQREKIALLATAVENSTRSVEALRLSLLDVRRNAASLASKGSNDA